jgi:ATP10 protein
MVVRITYSNSIIRRIQNNNTTGAASRIPNLFLAQCSTKRSSCINNVHDQFFFGTITTSFVVPTVITTTNHHHYQRKQHQQKQQLSHQNSPYTRYISSNNIKDKDDNNNKNEKQQEVVEEKNEQQQVTADLSKSPKLLELPKTLVPITDEVRNSDEYQKRHLGIILHPNSITNFIIPGNKILKRRKDGKIVPKSIELEYGYFWMIKDLDRCLQKPILSNTSLIPERTSIVFPSLPNVSSLGKSYINSVNTTTTSTSSGTTSSTDGATSTSSTSNGGFWSRFLSSSKSNNVITLPEYFVRKNRSNDPMANCTIVCISFRDFGFQHIKQWQEQIKEQQQQNNKSKNNNNDRIEVITLHISEGFIIKNVLQTAIRAITRRNTSPELYDTTFLYFSNGRSNDPMESFRDALRFHNTLVGYIVLVDGIGRVRYVASGEPSNNDVSNLLQLANELTPVSDINTTTSTSSKKQQQNQYHNTKRRR